MTAPDPTQDALDARSPRVEAGQPPVMRSYSPDDRDALIALWVTCGLTRSWNNPTRDIERKLARDAHNLVVLQIGHTLIGSVMVGYDGHRGWINYLAVHPDHQRNGMARKLMAEAETRLRRLGCPKVNLQVRTSNQAAVAFYRRIGYSVDDVISMGKRLELDDPAEGQVATSSE